MRRNAISDEHPRGSLSIRELAERTGVTQATLRSWETRYGTPRPRRLAGGHRRYAEDDVTLVAEIVRHRASGLSLPAAIDQAGARDEEIAPSLYAGLRRHHPDLVPLLLRKATLLALSRALENECCARAERPVLFGSFQRQTFYLQSRSRWAELARTSRYAVVFADFPEGPETEQSPVEIALPASAALRREWAVVCDVPDYPACLSAWELPGQDEDDSERRFETVWTVDPTVVRDAARICAHLTRASAPALGSALSEALSGAAAPASADSRRATGLLNRMIGYVDGQLRR